MIFGTSISDELGDELKVTLIATGFNIATSTETPSLINTVSLENTATHGNWEGGSPLDPSLVEQEKTPVNTQITLTLDDVLDSEVPEEVVVPDQIHRRSLHR